MEKRNVDYLYRAFNYLARNVIYVIIPVLLTSCLYLSKYVKKDLNFYYTIGIYALIAVIVPLLYGQFIEIITTGRKEKWKTILEKYWLKVFIVSMILKIPVIFLDLILPQSKILESILSLGIDILTIYVLPLVLLRDDIIRSIEMGIKCLIGNFKFSAPFVGILVLLAIISMIRTALAKYIDTQFIFYSSSIFLLFLSTFVNFFIFVSAALVLKDKVLNGKESNHS